MKFLARHEPNAYLLLRLVFGFLFACHGIGKLFGLPYLSMPGMPAFVPPVGTLIWWSAIIEAVAGALIFIGFLTRFAAIIASGEMAFAYFMVHAKGGFFPIHNAGETAVIYCFVALFIATHGAGRFGIDRS